MFWIFRKKAVEPIDTEEVVLSVDKRLTDELKMLLAGLPYKRPLCPVCKNNDFITGVSIGMQIEAPKPWRKYGLNAQGKSMGGCVLDFGIPTWRCLRCKGDYTADMSVFVSKDGYYDDIDG